MEETGGVVEDPTDRLRDVFDLFDVDRKGFITVDHFIELAKAHFTTDDDGSDSNQQDWNEVVSVLKADGNDRIDFADFCIRIKQILELQEKGPTNCADENLLYSTVQNGSIGVATPYEENGTAHGKADSDTRPLSSIFTHLRLPRTFSDECIPSTAEDTTDFGADVLVMNKHHQERTNSSLEEDYFEDNGQADAMENHLLAPFHKSLTPVSPRSISSQLYRGSSSVNISSRSSFSEEMIQNVIDDQSLQDLNDKIGRLQNHIEDLQESQRDNEQRQLRMKEENFTLSEKLLVLEEQVRDTEHRTRERLTEQQKRHSELMERINKENSTEIEILTLNLQSIQSEYHHLRSEVPVLTNENEKLSKENFQFEKERDSLLKQFGKLTEEHESLREHMHSEHNRMIQEQKVHRQLIHELTAELEELRHSKSDVLRANPSSGADLPRSLRNELEDHILQLKQENAVLRGQRDDLHAQVLHQHIQEGRSLLNHRTSPSDADLEKLPKAELIKVLQKETEANGKLREYVELITLRILEKNPSILEVSSMATT